MGIAPLAIVQLFCSSPERRLKREAELREFLLGFEEISLSSGSLLDGLTIEVPTEKERVPSIYADFLKVESDSNYGDISLFPISMVSAREQDIDFVESFTERLLYMRLCDTVVLLRGCMKKRLWSRWVPAIVASPDFARLAVLKRLDKINLAGLPNVVGLLDAAARHERYCEDSWKRLQLDCSSDSRYAEVLF